MDKAHAPLPSNVSASHVDPHGPHADGLPHSHVIPIWVYLAVWGALMAGTVLTVAASFVHIGPLNVPIMLLIATTKATLVALFFMHLYYDEKFNLVVLLAGLFFVFLFFAGTLQDMLTRGSVDSVERNPIAGEMDRAGIVKQPLIQEEEVPGAEHGATPAAGAAATTSTTAAPPLGAPTVTGGGATATGRASH